MPFSYLTAAKQIMLRTNQILDASDAGTLNLQWPNPLASMTNALMTPIPALKEMILASEKRIAEFIALDKMGIYRAAIGSRTADLANYANLPTVDTAGKEIIGVLGAALDSLTDHPMTEKKKQIVMRRLGSTFWKVPAFMYCLEDRKIIHTRTSMYFTCCFYDYAARATAYDANGNSVLPTACEVWLIADVLANIAQEDWFVGESQVYGNIVLSCKDDYRNRITPRATLPDTTVQEEPVGN